MNLTHGVAMRLARNCTLEEIEALEMIIRLKKGTEYGSGGDPSVVLPHPDHINLEALTSDRFSFIAAPHLSSVYNGYGHIHIKKANDSVH